MSSVRRRERRQGSTHSPESSTAHGLGVFLLPLGFTALLLALTLGSRVQASPALGWSIWGSAAVLLAWMATLVVQARAGGAPALEWGPARPQHYIQACCHLGIYTAWGWYWPPVAAFAPLLLAQLAFAYVFDILLAWSRRQPYQLGFGPIPIVFSTNLFLWFKDDWFAWQFVLIALGFLGKAFVRWERDGRLVHIFNPSAFTLAIFSIVLLATGTTDLTWGPEIASTFALGPRIYLTVFAIGLVVMYFFAVTPVTAMAAITLFAGSALFGAVTGTPYFIDSEIPAAVFLGLHLLVTDPSTSPRTTLGRAIFGVGYGLGVMALYAGLGALGLPTYYDKLLCVPLLNLLAPTIDRGVRALGDRPLLARLALTGPAGRFNLAHMAIWVVFFGAMTARGATDGTHQGDLLPFWQQACAENRTMACDRLLRIEASYCADNAGWACNELGRHHIEGRLVAADRERALAYFARACEGRFQAGCLNLLDPDQALAAAPRPLDFRLLLREGGPNLLEMPEPDLFARACRHGWSDACTRTTASR